MASSSERRASSPNGFSVVSASVGTVPYGFPCWRSDPRSVLDEAIEEMDGLRASGVRVDCSESIGSSEYSSEKTLGFEERPEPERRCIESVSGVEECDCDGEPEEKEDKEREWLDE